MAGRRRRFLFWSGLVLVVAGLVVIGYVVWQLYGTTWVSKREQRKIVESTERVWAGEASPTGDDRDLAADVVALVRIPVLGEEYVVPAHQGTSDDVLSRGFGVFEDAAAPGAVGNFALAGHRITHGEPLRRMPDLEAGDEIIVETADMTYTYVLDTDGDALTVGMDDTWVTASDPTDPATGRAVSEQVGSKRLISLVTCAELFHTDDRLVAFGHLVSRQRR